MDTLKDSLPFGAIKKILCPYTSLSLLPDNPPVIRPNYQNDSKISILLYNYEDVISFHFIKKCFHAFPKTELTEALWAWSFLSS